MTLSLLALIVASTMPSPTASPLKQIIRVRSTPFCTVFRENVFHAVQGLMVNDAIIAHGSDLIAKMGSDPNVHGMGQYQLGQMVYETASNLTKIYHLLNDPNRFRQDSTSDEDRDLLLMKARLQAVADVQERSLNILSGTYETSMLVDFVFKGNELNASLAGGSPDAAVDKRPTTTSKPRKPSHSIRNCYKAVSRSQVRRADLHRRRLPPPNGRFPGTNQHLKCGTVLPRLGG